MFGCLDVGVDIIVRDLSVLEFAHIRDISAEENRFSGDGSEFEDVCAGVVAIGDLDVQPVLDPILLHVVGW